MSALLPYAASPVVPYRHRVTAVPAVEPVQEALHRAGQDDTGHRTRSANASDRVRYDANSAAAAFAIHVLMEAGLAGEDPFANLRGFKAYKPRRLLPPRLRLIA